MTDQLLAVLREGWEGPAHRLSYFLDKGPDAGLRNTLAKVSADDASREIGGNSIAAHAGHVLFSFDAFGAFIAGDRTKRDWNQSWLVSTVDDASWAKLQSDLAARYEELLRTVETHAGAGEDALGGAIGVVAHLAYHIGAIRQKIAAL